MFKKTEDEADLFDMLHRRSHPGAQYYLNKSPVDEAVIRDLVEDEKQVYMLSEMKVDDNGRVDKIYFNRIHES